MNIVCLDMEGVLVPEIWIAFSEETGIPELRRTTRDEPDYGKLMRFRLDILKDTEQGVSIQKGEADWVQKVKSRAAGVECCHSRPSSSTLATVYHS